MRFVIWTLRPIFRWLYPLRVDHDDGFPRLIFERRFEWLPDIDAIERAFK